MGEIVNLTDARASAYKRDFMQSTEFQLIKSFLTHEELKDFLFFIAEFAEVLAEMEDYRVHYFRAIENGDEETIKKIGVQIESIRRWLSKLLMHFKELTDKVNLRVDFEWHL